MAELSRRRRAGSADATADGAQSTPLAGDFPDRAIILELSARVAELERLLDARTQAIVGLGARIAEMEGDAPAPLAGRIRELERELAQLRATKVLRYSAVPRRWYSRVRRGGT